MSNAASLVELTRAIDMGGYYREFWVAEIGM